jgi:hypothetical protein
MSGGGDLTLWKCLSSNDTAEGWQLISDQSVGGKSECSIEFAPPAESSGASSGSGVFAGVLNSDASGNSKLAKSGFCAARYRLPPRDEDLGQYEGLAMRVKSDGRTYTVNVQCDTWFADDLYQGFIVTPKDEWVTVELPFKQFLLTSAGYVRTEQRVFKPETLSTIALCLTSAKAPVVGVGLRLPGAVNSVEADDQRAVEEKFPDDGPFCIEVQWVKAVSKATDEHMSHSHFHRLISPTNASPFQPAGQGALSHAEQPWAGTPLRQGTAPR